jgi:Fe-S cluster biogenesis protein NfuA
MAITSPAREFRNRIERIESLIHEVEGSRDPEARARTQQILQAVLELHGTALERILETIAGAGESGRELIDSLGADDLVGCVLLLHGLHPLDLETRVLQALEQVRPLLRSHGGNVELLDLSGSVVRLRLLGSCDGCPSSAMTLKHAIEEAIYDKAPDVTAIEVEGGATNGHTHKDHQARILLPILGQ